VGHQHGRRCVHGLCLEESPTTSRCARSSSPSLPVTSRRGGSARWMSRWRTPGCSAPRSAAATRGASSTSSCGRPGARWMSAPLYLLHQRLLHDRVRQDVGGSLRDGGPGADALGVPLEAAWPYAPRPLRGAAARARPPRRAAPSHRRFRAGPAGRSGAPRLPRRRDPDRARLWIAASYPRGRPPTAACRAVPAGAARGAHALLLVGYSNRTPASSARNTWAPMGRRGVLLPGLRLRPRSSTSPSPAGHSARARASPSSPRSTPSPRTAPGADAAASGPVVAPSVSGLGGALDGGRSSAARRTADRAARPAPLPRRGRARRKRPMDLAVDPRCSHGAASWPGSPETRWRVRFVGGVIAPARNGVARRRYRSPSTPWAARSSRGGRRARAAPASVAPAAGVPSVDPGCSWTSYVRAAARGAARPARSLRRDATALGRLLRRGRPRCSAPLPPRPQVLRPTRDRGRARDPAVASRPGRVRGCRASPRRRAPRIPPRTRCSPPGGRQGAPPPRSASFNERHARARGRGGTWRAVRTRRAVWQPPGARARCSARSYHTWSATGEERGPLG
jgi:hypothetical protein